jgi:hypothetical protein
LVLIFSFHFLLIRMHFHQEFVSLKI